MAGDSPPNQADYKSTVLCQVCQHPNPLNAKTCALCGRSLDTPTTVIVPEKNLEDSWSNHLLSIARLHGDALVLYIMGKEQPVVFKGSGTIMLGRQASGSPPPTLDLALYNGHMLGVSRRHARINPTEDGYTIEDMDSANGTFVNETRLPAYQARPLRNGDIIRLGQLTFFVYFMPRRARRDMTPVKQTLSLVWPGDVSLYQALTIDQLTHLALPYLSALAGVQAILDEVFGRAASEMSFRILSVLPNQRIVTVQLTGHIEAVQLLEKKIFNWRASHHIEPGQFLSSDAALSGADGDAVEKPESIDELIRGTKTVEIQSAAPVRIESLPDEQKAALMELAQAVLAEAVPSLLDAARDIFAQNLLPYLLVVGFSAIEIVAD